MPFLIGMDEAGYGPNLGPLVVTAVAWEVSGPLAKTDLWREFEGVVAPQAATDGEHVQIADSKAVYTPARGLAALEAGVLAAMALWRGTNADGGECAPRTFVTFRECLTARTASDFPREPWYDGADLDLPHVTGDSNGNGKPSGDRHVPSWRERCAARGIRLAAIRSAFVSPEEFNVRTRQYDSKGQALSQISMHVLGQLWQELGVDGAGALIIADKHGGRNKYREFLPIVFGDRFIRCLEESLEVSRYRAGETEIRFETKSERYLPVALASMVSKYLRELAMVLFNRFWTLRLPHVRPTAGYPLDAGRFRSEIAALQRELEIPDEVLWRER
jgi:hypothetical protein